MTTITEFNNNIVPKLQKELGIANKHAVPKLLKLVVNCGLGEAINDKKVVDAMSAQLAVITGQKPKVTKAKKSISSFKLREGMSIGLKVTLRGKRMYDFLTRYISIALPRVRDFRGLRTSGFDGSGNYTVGVREQTIFPELDYSMVDKIRGFEISFVTSTSDDEHAKLLLTLLGVPFSKEK